MSITHGEPPPVAGPELEGIPSDIPPELLLGVLLALILLSAFFSGSETSLISLNRYRLKHLARNGHHGAERALALLERPDRLIGLILLGNNFVNILASSLATVLAVQLLGDAGIAIGAGILTVVVLVFAEVAPKTLAALHPERFAFPASFVLSLLMRVTWPLVWALNAISNTLLRLLGVRPGEGGMQPLSREELRSVVNEGGALIPQRHQQMLLSILDLEKVTVEDIMIPRNEIVGIDLEQDWDDIIKQLATTQHTRLPIFRSDIDNVVGLLHVRNLLGPLRRGELSREHLMEVIREPYFIPEATPLNHQLMQFQQQRRRIGLVVNEYGDIRGLVTLDDILEEIVGEFTTDPASRSRILVPQGDGTYLVDGATSIRELNRLLEWQLPTAGAKTLNGLITEYLESIPEPGTSILLRGYPVEIVQVSGNTVKTARIDPTFQPRSPNEVREA